MKNILKDQRERFHARIVVLEGNGRITALELVRASHEAKVSDVPPHVGLVISIGGIANTDEEFWRYAVDGKKIPKPAHECIPPKGSEVIWWYGEKKEPPAGER